MPHITIPAGDVDQGSVVDEALMSGKIKNNDDDHETRILALEALSGGGVAAADAKAVLATITAGGQTNEAKFWKLRHHIMSSSLPYSKNKDGQDFEKSDSSERFFHDPHFTVVSTWYGSSESYLVSEYGLANSEIIQFKIKKGENFFCLGFRDLTSGSTNMRVYLDGVNVNTVGLKNEFGATVPVSFSVQNASNRWGKTLHFYGLDGEEHVITIKNEHGSAAEALIMYVDVGYRSVDYAIDHKIKLNAGVAQVGNVAASFEEGEFTFTEPGIGLGNGYTGMLKINEGGTVTKVDGLSPARTEIKPNETISFSGAVTSLPVKNHWYFPTSGICLFQMPDGSSHVFSYSSKGQSGGPQTQTLDSIIWQSKPTEDFTFLKAKAGASAWNVNEFRGDGRIEYWAKPPIQIDGTNNKIDFEITINGVTTLHAATVASGWYSADLVPLSKAIKSAMQSAKPINGEYFAEWNELSQLWSVGVNDPEASLIVFKWATGANSASSLGPSIGFTSDSTGEKSYVASTTKQHKAHRVFIADSMPRSSEHPSIKYSFAQGSGSILASEAEGILDRLPGISSYRRVSSGGVLWDIYPDEDCCGIDLYFVKEDQGTYVTAQVDCGDRVWLLTTDRPNDTGAGHPVEGTLMHAFLSFPKGTHKITIKAENYNWFEMEDSTNAFIFCGYRQFFTKPPWESLTTQEKVLKTFEVWPLRLYGTYYGHNTALYTPQPTNDNINAITESGVWSQVTASQGFNNKTRSTSANGAYVDVEFVLAGNGGGIGIMTRDFTGNSLDADIFLSNAAINETTDKVEKIITQWGATFSDTVAIMHLGLPAGTYFLRMKNLSTAALENFAIAVYDTVPPQQNAPTLNDIANTGQSVAFPLHTRKREASRYGSRLINSFFTEGKVRTGIVSHFDYLLASHSTFDNTDDGDDVRNRNTMYWSTLRLANTSEYMQYTTFCRSFTAVPQFFSTTSTVVQPSVDSRNLNTVSTTVQVKGGAAPTTTRGSETPMVFFDFRFPCTFNASLTYNITDTRGMRTGKAILVDNTGAKEEVFIASFVTDTSFTIAKALTVLTPANIVTVLFWGMHNIRLTSGDNVAWRLNAYCFEPLPLEESVLEKRITATEEEEIVELTQALSATGADVQQPFEYPIHSDGEFGNADTTEIIHIRNALASTVQMYRGLKSIIPDSAQSVAARTLVCKSRRFIRNIDPKVRG